MSVLYICLYVLYFLFISPYHSADLLTDSILFSLFLYLYLLFHLCICLNFDSVPVFTKYLNAPISLRFAAGYGHCNVLQWLLQRGCDINFSPKGGSALIRAARFGHGERYLIYLFCFVLFCSVLFCFIVFCFGMVWYGMVWYGMVWYGIVWYGFFFFICSISFCIVLQCNAILLYVLFCLFFTFLFHVLFLP